MKLKISICGSAISSDCCLIHPNEYEEECETIRHSNSLEKVTEHEIMTEFERLEEINRELLKALKAMVKHMDSHDWGQPEVREAVETSRQLQNILSVINKAEGGQG